jgi:rubrerythrin
MDGDRKIMFSIYFDKKIEAIEKKLAKLEKDSHPQSDWICLDCGCNARKKETVTKKGDSNE